MSRSTIFYPTALQYVVPALHGRDQSPGVPRGADGDGAVFYRARDVFWGSGQGSSHEEVCRFGFPLWLSAGLYVYDHLTASLWHIQPPHAIHNKHALRDDDPAR
jgi:hypothetical protein